MANITDKQRDMIHPMFRQIAQDLTDNNITMQELIKDSFEMYPTEDSIKYITKQLAEKAWGVTSTNDLTTPQINTLIDMWVKKIAPYGIEVELPHE